jgi:DNA-binding NarL/FixJ family response regulator
MNSRSNRYPAEALFEFHKQEAVLASRRGRSNKEIACRLCWAEYTVKRAPSLHHVNSIGKRTQVASRNELELSLFFA